MLLSHDQHPDNLDDAGRRLLDSVPVVLTTGSAAAGLGGAAHGAGALAARAAAAPAGGELRVTGVPAQHGPDGTEAITGEVTGFVLSGTGCRRCMSAATTPRWGVVLAVAEHLGPVDVAVLFAGAARTPLLGRLPHPDQRPGRAGGADPGCPRSSSRSHTEGWQHFTQGPETIAPAFARHGAAGQLRPAGAGREHDDRSLGARARTTARSVHKRSFLC